MSSRSPRQSWFPVVLIVFVAVSVFYVLSYAPFQRYRYRADLPAPAPSREVWDELVRVDLDYRHTAYKPVEWLIDETPLKMPLLWWCGLWQVRDRAELEMELRKPFDELLPEPDYEYESR